MTCDTTRNVHVGRVLILIDAIFEKMEMTILHIYLSVQ